MFEGVFEGGVAEGVAGRVYGAVDVAQPVANGPKRVGDAGGAEGVDQDHHVVRCPRGNEGNQDGHDCASHLFLPGRSAFLFRFCHRTPLRYLERKRDGEDIFSQPGH